MPKLELGDLEAVERLKNVTCRCLPRSRAMVTRSSCRAIVHADVQAGIAANLPGRFRRGAVAEAMFDPFEYLVLRDKDGLLKKDFTRRWQGELPHSCHARVQNVGQKTREALEWCRDVGEHGRAMCGHDGTYGVKSEFYAASMKTASPCSGRWGERAGLRELRLPIAGRRILQESTIRRGAPRKEEHPLTLLRMAYGLEQEPGS